VNRVAHKITLVNFVALCPVGETLGFPDANLAVMTEPAPINEKEPNFAPI
jgi:hypothetical protein